MAKKVLITTNPLDHEGGVVNYYRLFLKNFHCSGIDLVHLPFGSRMKDFYSPWKKNLIYPMYLGFDLGRLIFLLVTDRSVGLVQVSPSLQPVPLIRDAFIVLVAKALQRKTLVFYRGWRESTASTLKNNRIARGLFRFVYGHVDLTMVLASRFKEDLLALGWSSSTIDVTTTMYEGDHILPATNRTGHPARFLFLGRVSQLKGVGELIEAAKILAGRGIDFECIIVGHGDRKGVVEGYESCIRESGLEGLVRFTGRLTGSDKYRAYADSDIFVLPSWTEGCPNSVLEALGSGLFVVSTGVGALRDIICDGRNGSVVRSKDHEHLAQTLAWVCENIEEIRKSREMIQKDAFRRFEAQRIYEYFRGVYQHLLGFDENKAKCSVSSRM
jgi:glycosyltransferase involved in cell wall biosynthesis